MPIAAASIGQVHGAVLPTGERVAVKVQRPAAEAQVEADIALLYQLARLAREHVRRLDFIDAVGLVDEFARAIRAELDYRSEARNAELFHAAFAGDERVVVPRVYWHLSTQRVLVLELLDGMLLRDVADTGTPEERERVAYAVATLWMEMVFRKGLFHADPHPANILVLPDGRIGLVDFGVAGRISPDDMRRLIRLFIDAVSGNSAAFPRRLQELGVRYPREREEDLRADLEALWQRYAGVEPGRGRPQRAAARAARRDPPPPAAAAHPVPAARPGADHARLRRAGAVPGVQRVRAGPAVRPGAGARAVLAGGDPLPGPGGDGRLDPGDARPAARRRGAGRGADRAATSRSPSASQGWTSRSAASMRRRTGSSWPSC